jgi:hypothetical protein
MGLVNTNLIIMRSLIRFNMGYDSAGSTTENPCERI